MLSHNLRLVRLPSQCVQFTPRAKLKEKLINVGQVNTYTYLLPLCTASLTLKNDIVKTCLYISINVKFHLKKVFQDSRWSIPNMGRAPGHHGSCILSPKR